jgi:AraC family transcriptional regulator, regulatory protein of adaptative response / DNA-3-methyladenine glycosylase II
MTTAANVSGGGNISDERDERDERDDDALYRAVASRDPRFAGRFVVAVTSTRIYCRPGVCPAKIPLRKNVRFYPSPAAAQADGFRACARCRPELATWLGTTSTVRRALGLIDGGALDDGNLATLAERLVVGDRHLRRLFQQHLGASPLQVALTRRAHFARRLVDETTLPLTEVAFAAGFASVRRFNAAMKAAFGRAPSQLRHKRASVAPAKPGLTLRLPFRAPFAWTPLVEFLAARAIPGVEVVAPDCYRRTLSDADGEAGVLEVRPARDHLALTLRLPSTRGLRDAVERARHLFDLDAEPNAVAQNFARDRVLRTLAQRLPGLRVPGAWDPFEVAVRAILGQQVSVLRATRLCGKLVAAWGEPLAHPEPGLTHLFPPAAKLARVGGDELARVIGMPRARGRALAAMATAIATRALILDGARPLDALVADLCALPGVGPWTASYLAMRLHQADAFPAGDLWLRRAFSADGEDERKLVARAEAWRPFRAYAAMYLWNAGGSRDDDDDDAKDD